MKFRVLGLLVIGAVCHLHGSQAASERLDLAPACKNELQVSSLCESGDNYLAQYMGDQGRWMSSQDTKGCLTDKLEILEFCKKAYPKRAITNIVESAHYVRVGGWCKPGKTKCKMSRWVKPYRCLEGPFQSDALLVPESCLFDHLHNETRCWESYRWNTAASDTCRDRNMNLRSFAMLLPCGISLFAGVEFVCCPKHLKENMKVKKHTEMHLPKPMEDDCEDEDEAVLSDEAEQDDDSDEEEEESDAYENLDDVLSDQQDDDDPNDDYFEDYDGTTKQSSTSSTTRNPPSTNIIVEKLKDEVSSTPSPSTLGSGASSSSQQPSLPYVAHGTPDPYLTHFDPRLEHKSYKQAQMRLEEIHKEEVTKVMKDWSDLEERYQDIRARDPVAADAFKRWMTVRFQQTVAALEASGAAEKHHLSAMHQQRVQETVKQRNEEAMSCYISALNETPPNEHRIQKCLQKLLRALHKDRHHTIAHYKHLLDSGLEQAQREKPATLEHLADIDRITNESFLMLDRYPGLSGKIGKLMNDYVMALRSKDDTPGLHLTMTREAEEAILDKFQADIAAKLQEKEHQKQLERERKEQRKAEKSELQRSEEERLKVEEETVSSDTVSVTNSNSNSNSDSIISNSNTSSNSDIDDVDDNEDQDDVDDSGSDDKSDAESSQSEEDSKPKEVIPLGGLVAAAQTAFSSSSSPASAPSTSSSVAIKHEEPEIKVSHSMVHEFSHPEVGYSVRREVYHRESRSVYFTMAFAGIAFMAAAVVGLAVFKRRSARSPHSQGFIEVEQSATPEERHVSQMQINGYENPTYKYFEVKE